MEKIINRKMPNKQKWGKLQMNGKKMNKGQEIIKTMSIRKESII